MSHPGGTWKAKSQQLGTLVLVSKLPSHISTQLVTCNNTNKFISHGCKKKSKIKMFRVGSF